MSISSQTVDAPEEKAAYNYEQFNAGDNELQAFAGPAVGDKAIDFEATTLDGKAVKLSDFYGRVIVLETGSITT